MSKLDGIVARADAYAEHGTPGLNAPKDRKDLLDAVRAVEAVHVSTCEVSGMDCDTPVCSVRICGPCGESWPCPTITAIREALG